ncbi:hypothetical protein [Pelosinus propionicus]|uniref:hypothetical protein n=1 Tax=Pelosinus propionicus TaxID=380084 RepID=UPI00111461DA|nr:hypothetical protein [Pelosinus propionicus]
MKEHKARFCHSINHSEHQQRGIAAGVYFFRPHHHEKMIASFIILMLLLQSVIPTKIRVEVSLF